MKAISIIAAAILASLVYVGMVLLTKDFFIPHAIMIELEVWKTPNDYAGFLGAFWPITWIIWGGFRVATDYTLATILSLVLLAGFYPSSRLVSKLWTGHHHALKLKVERKAQEPLQDRELDAYLKSEGVYLRDYEDMETFI